MSNLYINPVVRLLMTHNSDFPPERFLTMMLSEPPFTQFAHTNPSPIDPDKSPDAPPTIEPDKPEPITPEHPDPTPVEPPGTTPPPIIPPQPSPPFPSDPIIS